MSNTAADVSLQQARKIYQQNPANDEAHWALFELKNSPVDHQNKAISEQIGLSSVPAAIVAASLPLLLPAVEHVGPEPGAPGSAAVAVLESAVTALSEVVIAVEAVAGTEFVAGFAAEDAELIVLAVGFVAVVFVAESASEDAVEHSVLLVDLELPPFVMEALLVEAVLAEIDRYRYLGLRPAASPFAGQGDFVQLDAAAAVVAGAIVVAAVVAVAVAAAVVVVAPG